MKLDYSGSFVNEEEINKCMKIIKECHDKLHKKNGEGNEFLGWLNLKLDEKEYLQIKDAAKDIREQSDYLIVIGIGGSYLGSKAIIESLSHAFNHKNVIFAGIDMSPDYINDLLEFIDGKNISLNVISKSGTTIEPAISFKILREYMENKYGIEEAAKRIYVTTDKNKGILRELAIKKGYRMFVVPDDIGGRYSVMTAVGLLPIAAAGINIDKILEGVYEATERYSNLYDNDCYIYAAIRNILYNKGKKIELLVNYEPKLKYITEWWKQLFGESEGKNGMGIFPVGLNYTTDLHSLGQYVQDGERTIFETVINVEEPYRDYVFDKNLSNEDSLSYISGMSLNQINHYAMEGTKIAHINGNVPNIVLNIEKINEYEIGKLIYFFEKACAVSAYMLGVNPFNQPGVEQYKKEMFRLLGK